MKDSEPAFPCNSPDGLESYSGMTLRDYFAGQALAGLMGYWAERINFITKPFVAEIAYEFADAVIAVKHKETECIKEQSETTDSETAADDYSKPYSVSDCKTEVRYAFLAGVEWHRRNCK